MKQLKVKLHSQTRGESQLKLQIERIMHEKRKAWKSLRKLYRLRSEKLKQLRNLLNEKVELQNHRQKVRRKYSESLQETRYKNWIKKWQRLVEKQKKLLKDVRLEQKSCNNKLKMTTKKLIHRMKQNKNINIYTNHILELFNNWNRFCEDLKSRKNYDQIMEGKQQKLKRRVQILANSFSGIETDIDTVKWYMNALRMLRSESKAIFTSKGRKKYNKNIEPPRNTTLKKNHSPERIREISLDVLYAEDTISSKFRKYGDLIKNSDPFSRKLANKTRNEVAKPKRTASQQISQPLRNKHLTARLNAQKDFIKKFLRDQMTRKDDKINFHKYKKSNFLDKKSEDLKKKKMTKKRQQLIKNKVEKEDIDLSGVRFENFSNLEKSSLKEKSELSNLKTKPNLAMVSVLSISTKGNSEELIALNKYARRKNKKKAVIPEGSRNAKSYAEYSKKHIEREQIRRTGKFREKKASVKVKRSVGINPKHKFNYALKGEVRNTREKTGKYADVDKLDVTKNGLKTKSKKAEEVNKLPELKSEYKTNSLTDKDDISTSHRATKFKRKIPMRRLSSKKTKRRKNNNLKSKSRNVFPSTMEEPSKKKNNAEIGKNEKLLLLEELNKRKQPTEYKTIFSVKKREGKRWTTKTQKSHWRPTKKYTNSDFREKTKPKADDQTERSSLMSNKVDYQGDTSSPLENELRSSVPLAQRKQAIMRRRALQTLETKLTPSLSRSKSINKRIRPKKTISHRIHKAARRPSLTDSPQNLLSAWKHKKFAEIYSILEHKESKRKDHPDPRDKMRVLKVNTFLRHVNQETDSASLSLDADDVWSELKKTHKQIIDKGDKDHADVKEVLNTKYLTEVHKKVEKVVNKGKKNREMERPEKLEKYVGKLSKKKLIDDSPSPTNGLPSYFNYDLELSTPEKVLAAMSERAAKAKEAKLKKEKRKKTHSHDETANQKRESIAHYKVGDTFKNLESHPETSPSKDTMGSAASILVHTYKTNVNNADERYIRCQRLFELIFSDKTPANGSDIKLFEEYAENPDKFNQLLRELYDGRTNPSVNAYDRNLFESQFETTMRKRDLSRRQTQLYRFGYSETSLNIEENEINSISQLCTLPFDEDTQEQIKSSWERHFANMEKSPLLMQLQKERSEKERALRKAERRALRLQRRERRKRIIKCTHCLYDNPRMTCRQKQTLDSMSSSHEDELKVPNKICSECGLQRCNSIFSIDENKWDTEHGGTFYPNETQLKNALELREICSHCGGMKQVKRRILPQKNIIAKKSNIFCTFCTIHCPCDCRSARITIPEKIMYPYRVLRLPMSKA